jgi:lactoylglutathione lyase
MLGLRTCIYKVGSLDEAKVWYSKAFQSSPYFDEPFYVGFNIGGFELGLVPEDEVMDEKSANVLTYWGVDDIEAEFQRLIGLGAQEYEKPNNVGGEIIVAGVKDLWGNVIGIIYNPVFTIPNR